MSWQSRCGRGWRGWLMMVAIASASLLFAGMLQAARAETARMVGEWRGSYTCVQGLTGLTLVIEEQIGENFTGVFHFYAVKDNPSVPEGCYEISGRAGPTGRVDILGLRWLKQPASYVTVNLTGQLTSDARNLLGVVSMPANPRLCSGFRVAKASQTPRLPEACKRAAPAISRLE